MKKIFYLALIPFFAALGCSKEEEKVSPQKLIGTWQEQQEPAFASDIYNISITPDSFNIKIKRSDDAIIPNHPCGELQYSRTDYALGTYTISNDTIKFDGLFVDGCKQPQQNSCYSVGSYQESFTYKLSGQDLILQPIHSNGFPSFRLQKTTDLPWPCTSQTKSGM